MDKHADTVASRSRASCFARVWVSGETRPLVQLATRRYDLDLPAALDEVVDDERDDNEDDRERKKPGPPAVSCDEHIDLRCWGWAHHGAAMCFQYLPKAEKSQALASPRDARFFRRRAPLTPLGGIPTPDKRQNVCGSSVSRSAWLSGFCEDPDTGGESLGREAYAAGDTGRAPRFLPPQAPGTTRGCARCQARHSHRAPREDKHRVEPRRSFGAAPAPSAESWQ